MVLGLFFIKNVFLMLGRMVHAFSLSGVRNIKTLNISLFFLETGSSCVDQVSLHKDSQASAS